MFSVVPYVFLSFLGILWGIVPGSPESAFGKVLYEATLFMGSTFFVVAIAATFLSLILRKKEKNKSKHLGKRCFFTLYSDSSHRQFPCWKDFINVKEFFGFKTKNEKFFKKLLKKC